MTIDVYFLTDIRSTKQTEGAIYGLTLGTTPKGKEARVYYKKEITANGAGASVQALHDMVAGDEHRIREPHGHHIVIHSTSPYVTGCLKNLGKWSKEKWKTSKGADIKYKEMWQEIHCNIKGHEVEVIEEDPEEVRKIIEE